MNKGMWKRNLRRGAALALTLVMSLSIAACGAGTTTKVYFPEENRIERAENVKEVEQYIARIDEMIERKERLLAPWKTV